MNETLWLRALRAVDARGLLPNRRASLTPREIAAQAALRGEQRLQQLVEGWYYPRSYGQIHGTLTEEEAGGIVALLEAETQTETEHLRVERTAPVAEPPPKPRVTSCDLCGRPVMPSP
jgi:hypothetical protein